MTAQKSSPASTGAKHQGEADIVPPRTPLPTEAGPRAGAAFALSAIGMGLAMQSATHAGAAMLSTGDGEDRTDSAESAGQDMAGSAAVGNGGPAEISAGSDLRLANASLDAAAPADAATVDVAIEVPRGPALAFAPPLGADKAEGVGDVPIRVASNTTLPLSSTATVSVQVPVTPSTAPLSPLETGGGQATDPVDTILDPVLGEDGLLADVIETVTEGLLDPLLGDEGLLGTVLDPVLGEDGIVDTVLDPLLGEDGLLADVVDTVADGLLDPVLGDDGLLGSVLDPVLGEDGIVDTVLDPLLGEDGAVGGALDPVLGEDGLLADVLSPVLGEDGLLEPVLSPVLDNLGPAGGLVESVLGGLFGSTGDGTAMAQAAQPLASDGLLAEIDGLAAESIPLVDDLGVGDDGGFVESLIGEATLLVGADSYEGMADLLSTSTDQVLNGLLSDDYLSDFDVQETAGGDDGLLGEMLDLGLSGALAQESVLGMTPLGDETAPDPELDALLSEILDSGERMIGGVTDPLTELLDLAPEDEDTNGLFGLDLEPAVEDALETLFGDVPVDAGQLSPVLGDGGLLGGPVSINSEDDPA